MLTVLSTFDRHRVRALLMGGQACILYGAAEFTRDADFAVDPDEANVERLQAALSELRGERVYVPSLSTEMLQRGHACHFRCKRPELSNWRVDLMSVMRGCGDFLTLWKQRRSIALPEYGKVQVLDIASLIRSKKTQRAKDWPMIARLVEADYARAAKRAPRDRVVFWLREARTVDLLSVLVRRFRGTAQRVSGERPAVAAALAGDHGKVSRALQTEERRERNADRKYWEPLRAELQVMRRAARRK